MAITDLEDDLGKIEVRKWRQKVHGRIEWHAVVQEVKDKLKSSIHHHS